MRRGQKQEDFKISAAFGTRLRTFRKIHKITQTDLARVLGVSFQQVQKYESGQNRISCVAVYKITQYYRMPVSFFFEYLPID